MNSRPTKPDAERCFFAFDGCGMQHWPGFTDGTKWNGWDNVRVTAETHGAILASMGAEADTELAQLKPDDDGLYSYGYYFTVSIGNKEHVLGCIAQNAMLALEAEAKRHGHTLDDEDYDQWDTDADNLLAWASDLESRLGYSVGDFRAHVIDYCLTRSGGNAPDEVEHVAELYTQYLSE